MNFLSPIETLDGVLSIVESNGPNAGQSISILQIHEHFKEKFGYHVNNTILSLVIERLLKDGYIKNSPGSNCSYFINYNALETIDKSSYAKEFNYDNRLQLLEKGQKKLTILTTGILAGLIIAAAYYLLEIFRIWSPYFK